MKMQKVLSRNCALQIATHLQKHQPTAVEKWLAGSNEELFRDEIDCLTGGELDTTQLDLMCDWVWRHLDHWDSIAAITDDRHRQAMGC